MTLYMPPIARKKRVPERYNPDSFRVISTNAEDAHPKFEGDNFYCSPDQEQFKRGIALPDIYNRTTKVLPKEEPDYRVHRPHPNSCGFLRHNVRILNEPICSVYTGETHNEQHMWWPSRTSDEPLKVPPKTKDTIYRDGYMRDHPISAKGFTRHEANPNKNAAYGVVPVNFLHEPDGQKRLLQEKISFEHQYNSRKDPSYPIRNKRHGSFVWDQVTKEKAEHWIQEQKRLDEIEKNEKKSTDLDGATLVMPPFSPPQPLSQNEKDSPAKSPPGYTVQSPKRLTPPASEKMNGCGDTPSKTGKEPSPSEQTVQQTTVSA